jgi:hypothetical protein
MIAVPGGEFGGVFGPKENPPNPSTFSITCAPVLMGRSYHLLAHLPKRGVDATIGVDFALFSGARSR